MENLTKGYECTYDARDNRFDYSCNRRGNFCCEHNSTHYRASLKSEEVDIKKAAPSPKVKLLFWCLHL